MALDAVRRPLSARALARIHKILFERHSLLRRLIPLEPVSRTFGSDRGLPIDRYYIERFLGQRRADICGAVLEVAEDTYTRRFGSDVQSTSILHVDGQQCPQATLIADLADWQSLPADRFDCFVCTQTLQYVYDFSAGVRGAYRMLRPGGVLLATLPTVSRRSVGDNQDWQEYWRFTSSVARRGFAEVFGEENVTVEAHGNVLAATAFLLGLATHEIGRRKLDQGDPDYEVLITVRAVKPG